MVFIGLRLWGVFITYDTEKMYTYVCCRDSVHGKHDNPGLGMGGYGVKETTEDDEKSCELWAGWMVVVEALHTLDLHWCGNCALW